MTNEVGFTPVDDLPKLSRLQLETGDPNRTHHSIGQDEKGPNDFPTLNPHRQTSGFADKFAWGYRAIIVGEFNDVIFGWPFRPQLGVHWDVHGTAPSQLPTFVDRRQHYAFVTPINVTDALSTRLT